MNKDKINAYYQRTFVFEILKIFENPRPPTFLTERQFDGFQDDLEQIAFREWHEISHSQWIYYLEDLVHEPLQQDVFDHLFPYFLVTWREGLVRFENRPQCNEYDLYLGLIKGDVLNRMMPSKRKKRVLTWMADGFLESVNSLSSDQAQDGGGHFFLAVLHALGQSCPIHDRLLNRLTVEHSQGGIRLWYTLAVGLCTHQNFLPWKHDYSLLSSETSYQQGGYLPENLSAWKNHVSIEQLHKILSASVAQFQNEEESTLIHLCLEHMERHPDRVTTKLDWMTQNLAKPGLGFEPEEPTYPTSPL